MLRPRFKTLESLVQRTALRLKQLSDENRKLKLDLAHAREEYGRLDDEIKRLRGLGAKHEKLRTKIERLVHKLDKVAG